MGRINCHLSSNRLMFSFCSVNTFFYHASFVYIHASRVFSSEVMKTYLMISSNIFWRSAHCHSCIPLVTSQCSFSLVIKLRHFRSSVTFLGSWFGKSDYKCKITIIDIIQTTPQSSHSPWSNLKSFLVFSGMLAL